MPEARTGFSGTINFFFKDKHQYQHVPFKFINILICSGNVHLILLSWEWTLKLEKANGPTHFLYTWRLISDECLSCCGQPCASSFWPWKHHTESTTGGSQTDFTCCRHLGDSPEDNEYSKNSLQSHLPVPWQPRTFPN